MTVAANTQEIPSPLTGQCTPSMLPEHSLAQVEDDETPNVERHDPRRGAFTSGGRVGRLRLGGFGRGGLLGGGPVGSFGLGRFGLFGFFGLVRLLVVAHRHRRASKIFVAPSRKK